MTQAPSGQDALTLRKPGMVATTNLAGVDVIKSGTRRLKPLISKSPWFAQALACASAGRMALYTCPQLRKGGIGSFTRAPNLPA